jgi:hypothetical protein
MMTNDQINIGEISQNNMLGLNASSLTTKMGALNLGQKMHSTPVKGEQPIYEMTEENDDGYYSP